MAKVVLAADIQDMRGKIGNNVFSKARSGNTVRARVKVRNPRTSAQTGARAAFAHAAVGYKNLTLPQLAAWASYANGQTHHDALSGDNYVPSANTVFVALASKFLQVNPVGTIPVTPPAAAFSGDTIAVTAIGATGTVTFTGSGSNAANVKTELLLNALKSRARTPSPNGYRTKAFIAYAAAPLTDSVTVPAGYYVPAYRFVNTATGQASSLITLPMVQVL